MNLRQCFLTKNDCYKSGRKIKPLGMMLHSTGANNPKLSRYLPDDGKIGINELGNHWNRQDVAKCVNAFIGRLADGSVATVWTLPWEMRSWHCGGAGNGTHISVEICEDGLDNAAYFLQVLTEAADLCAFFSATLKAMHGA